MNEYRSEAPRVIVIGGSAGCVTPLMQLLQQLPADFPATILIVIHIQASQSIALAATLEQHCELPIVDAMHCTTLAQGHVYIAPPDRHLLVALTQLQVVMGAKEHGFRPAIDPLFRTAARDYGDRVIGVILSGALWDGTAGLAAVRAQGGVTIVQDPQQALVPSMPQSAINYGVVDYVLSVTDIAHQLITFTR